MFIDRKKLQDSIGPGWQGAMLRVIQSEYFEHFLNLNTHEGFALCESKKQKKIGQKSVTWRSVLMESSK